ncbi:MAG: TlyA family RNA methyltransferase [Oscillospiraceae bacterium]|nr:TlyA family RNA methyltransferase [Oscillospiraceae bacterium]
MRADEYLVKSGSAVSRQRAKELIQSGGVLIGGKPVKKPSSEVTGDEEIQIIGETLKYVSRGGLKLEKAAKVFDISFEGKKCVDFGASTGGFTDCMLRGGAEIVYAVDVGHGQLDKKLLSDGRVVNMEGFNLRNITAADIGGKADILVCDVSFISLKLIMRGMADVLKDSGEAAVLIKPQFECGRQDVGKNGIVRSKKVHVRVLNEIFAAFADNGLYADRFDYSPICGGDGNIEYIAHVIHSGGTYPALCCNFSELVDDAFDTLGNRKE